MVLKEMVWQRVYAHVWIAAPVCIENDWPEDPEMTQVSPPVAPTPGRKGRVASEVVAGRLSAEPGSIARVLEGIFMNYQDDYLCDATLL